METTGKNHFSIHQLHCKDCNALYIDQTGCNSNARIKEHLSSFSYKKTDCTFANHFISENYGFGKTEMVHFFEALEIHKIQITKF